MVTNGELYEKAQLAMISLKSAVLMLLDREDKSGLRNVEIGRTLGIYETPSGKQEGWVSAHILELLEAEGRVHRINPGARWALSD